MSNLPYLSTVLERIVRLSHQSAYRPLHSTETTLLRVSNDILMALDQQKAAMLVLLELSVAFDTIDHGMLLSRLSDIRIQDTAHDWLRSHLNNRCQSININGCKSQSGCKSPLRYGVPQGSVLGLFLFTKYTVSIDAIYKKHEVSYQEIRAWMVMHRLELNDDRIEFVYLVSWNNTKSISIEPITIADIIPPTSSERNIGVIFDNTFQMNVQVGEVCQACYFWLKNIHRVRSHLTLTATCQIVHWLSEDYYFNSFLQGLPKYQLARLQRVQNAAARVIACIPRHEHISEIRMQLHWLPIQQRIIYKILLLTILVVHGKAPEYLSELLVLHKPNRAL